MDLTIRLVKSGFFVFKFHNLKFSREACTVRIKMDFTKWPSLLSSTVPVKKIPELSAPLNMKSVPKWVTDELSRRQRSSIDECDTSDTEVSETESSIASTHSEVNKKTPITNFIHFSPLLATFVCLTPHIKTDDPSLEKVGSDVAKLIQKCIVPFSLYGRIMRESGEDSLVVKFRVPGEVLAPVGVPAAIADILVSRHVPHVQYDWTTLRPDAACTAEEEKTIDGATDRMETISPSGDPSGTHGSTKGVQSPDAEMATVCFTIPCHFCIPLIQRILEKTKMMAPVREALLSAKVSCAIQLISKLVEEKSAGAWNDNKKTQMSAVYSFRSHLNFRCGDFMNALMDAQKAIELDPCQVEGYAVATKSYIALGHPELARAVAADAHTRLSFLTTRFIRGSLLSSIIPAFQKWRSGPDGVKMRLEVTISASSAETRHAVLDSYLTHPLKHPNHPGLSVGGFADLEVAGRNGFPDSARATATWISFVYSSSLTLLKTELLDFCTSPMFFTCRSNRVHATRAFNPNSQIFEEKISVLLPVLSSTTRICMNGSAVVRPGDGVVWCYYCGGIIQVESSRAPMPSFVCCSLGCGATYCSESCRNRAAAEYHWIECPQSVLLNIGARAFLELDYFITSLAPDIRLTKKCAKEKINDTPDLLSAIGISMRLYKQIMATVLSFALPALLGVHPMSQMMEERVNISAIKMEQLLQELDYAKIKPGLAVDKYNLLLAEKVLQALDIPFVTDANYSASPTVAEELILCPSPDLIPHISRRDLKFGSAEQEVVSIIPPDVKTCCAQKIWLFSQKIMAAIRENLHEEPLTDIQSEAPGCADDDPLPIFLGAPRFIPQLWDFCCTAYCVAETTYASPSIDSKWREQASKELTVPVIIISPHLSVATDLADFTGSYAYSRYCFEHEIQARAVQPSADESIMSVRSLNESELSISSQPQSVTDAYDPSPWTQWCTAIATGCTSIDTPLVSVQEQEPGGLPERLVSVTCSGPVQLDDMIRLKSASCVVILGLRTKLFFFSHYHLVFFQPFYLLIVTLFCDTMVSRRYGNHSDEPFTYSLMADWMATSYCHQTLC
eukprot:gene10673-7417_t